MTCPQDRACQSGMGQGLFSNCLVLLLQSVVDKVKTFLGSQQLALELLTNICSAEDGMCCGEMRKLKGADDGRCAARRNRGRGRSTALHCTFLVTIVVNGHLIAYHSLPILSVPAMQKRTMQLGGKTRTTWG